MNDLLSQLVNQRVEVRSQGGEQVGRDEGKLVAYDERWIQLQTSAGETLFFSVANVSLVKPLKWFHYEKFFTQSTSHPLRCFGSCIRRARHRRREPQAANAKSRDCAAAIGAVVVFAERGLPSTSAATSASVSIAASAAVYVISTPAQIQSARFALV